MKRAAFLFKRLAQPVKIGLIVFLAKEAGLTVMPPLHEVQGDTIKMNTDAARHVKHHNQINVSLAPLITFDWYFDTEEEAKFVFSLLTSMAALQFLDSIIFLDEKRPITIDVLRRLSLKAVAEDIGLKDAYMYWADSNKLSSTGQLELGIAEAKSHYKVNART